MLTQELLDDDAPMDAAAIPDEHDRPAQVAQEVAQEPDDLQPRDVGGVETEVEPQFLARGRDGDGGDGRDAIPPVAVPEDGGPADRGPGLADVRDEEEAALVEEREMGPKPAGFFLSGAIAASSSVRWPPRPSAWRGVPASATSIPSPSSPATRDQGDRRSRSASRSAWRCAAGSRVASHIPPRQHRAPAAAAACAFDPGTGAGDGPASASAATRPRRHRGMPGPTAPRSLSRRSGSPPPTGTSCRL